MKKYGCNLCREPSIAPPMSPARPCPPRSGDGPLGAAPISNRHNGCSTSAAGRPAPPSAPPPHAAGKAGAKRRGIGCIPSRSFTGRRVGRSLRNKRHACRPQPQSIKHRSSAHSFICYLSVNSLHPVARQVGRRTSGHCASGEQSTKQ